MTLDQLRVFVAVAERLHVTRAAEALNLAQSAASAAIAALEAKHGVRLFNRVGRHIELTASGSAFLIDARAVLARTAAAERTLADIAGLARGILSVQASQTIAGYWLPRHLVAFRAAHPRVEIRLGIGNTAQVAEAVRIGGAELGCVEGTVDDPALAGREIARDQLLIVVGPEHPWAGRHKVEPGELADSQWVLREPGSGTRSVFEAALTAFGVGKVPVALELPSNEAVRAAVEAGLGASALSASVAASGIEAGLLHPVALRLPDRAFTVLHHRERSLSRAAAAFLERLA